MRVEGDKKGAKVQKLSKGEILMVNIGSLSTGGKVTAVKADLAKISLTQVALRLVVTFKCASKMIICEAHWKVIIISIT